VTSTTERANPLRRWNPDWGGCSTARRPVAAVNQVFLRRSGFVKRHHPPADHARFTGRVPVSRTDHGRLLAQVSAPALSPAGREIGTATSVLRKPRAEIVAGVRGNAGDDCRFVRAEALPSSRFGVAVANARSSLRPRISQLHADRSRPRSGTGRNRRVADSLREGHGRLAADPQRMKDHVGWRLDSSQSSPRPPSLHPLRPRDADAAACCRSRSGRPRRRGQTAGPTGSRRGRCLVIAIVSSTDRPRFASRQI
jgi:hypothetical protein